MQTKIEKLPKSTIKLTVTLEAAAVKDAYEKALDRAVLDTEIQGFRKGNAPREMVKDKIGVSTIYGEVINDLLQAFYPQALKENKILPVSNPKVDIKDFDLEKDLVFDAIVAVKPEITIGDYKKALKVKYDAKKAQKTKENEEKLKKGEKLDDGHVHLGTNDVVETLLNETKVEIADLLIEDEVDRMMTRLVNQVQAVGLSMENYLRSQNKTADQLRKDYSAIGEKNMATEFILAHLVTAEKIEVEDKEIEDTIAAIGDPSMKAKLGDPMEKLYIKSILQKNKLISKLIEEAEGENHHVH